MGAVCGCCGPNDAEGPKDESDRHDREPLLQREGSHSSIEDVHPAVDPPRDQPTIPIEQRHIDLVNNHPLSSESPTKAQQKRIRSPHKGDGLYFENPHEIDSESQDPLAAAESQSTTLSPTHVHPEVLPYVIETNAVLHNQDPLVSQLIPQSDDEVLVDPIQTRKGSKYVPGTQGDPKFSEWVSAEDGTIPDVHVGALNEDRPSGLFDLQNASTSPAGHGISISPQMLNPASTIGSNAATPLIPSAVSEASNVPTIDWSGNIMPTPQASTPGQFGSEAGYGPLTSAAPRQVLVPQPLATSNPGPVAAIVDPAGGIIDPSATAPQKDLRHNEENASVPSMESLNTSKQEKLGKLLEKEITMAGKHDSVMIAASKGKIQGTQDPVSIRGGAVDVQAEASVPQPQSLLPETKANANKEQVASSQGHPTTESLDSKAQRSDITPVELDITQQQLNVPQVTVVGAVPLHSNLTRDVSRATDDAAGVKKEDIAVDIARKKHKKEKEKDKKANDGSVLSKDDASGQRKGDSPLDFLAGDGIGAIGEEKQEPDSSHGSVFDKIPVSLHKQGTDKTELPPGEPVQGDGASSHPTSTTDKVSEKPTFPVTVDTGVENIDVVKSIGSTNVLTGDVPEERAKQIDSQPVKFDAELLVTPTKMEEDPSQRHSGKESFDANANLQRLEFEETGLPELDEKYKLLTHLFNEYFDKFNLLHIDYKQMLTAYEKSGLKCASLLPVFLMLKGQLSEDGKSCLKLERTNCYQVVFEPGHVSKEGATIFRCFNNSNRLLTDLICEGRNSVIERARLIIDSEESTMKTISERFPGPEQEHIKLAVSKVVVMMRNVIPSVNYMIIEAMRVQDDLEGAALVLFTQGEERERVEAHLTTKRSFIKL